jgi:hypothetical protein
MSAAERKGRDDLFECTRSHNTVRTSSLRKAAPPFFEASASSVPDAAWRLGRVLLRLLLLL